MANYNCPTCGEKIQRDMILFYKHTDTHVVEEIRKLHPKWMSDDGYCPKCLDYFKQQMGQGQASGPPGQANMGRAVNIGAGGVRQRKALGLLLFLASIAAFIYLYAQEVPKTWRLLLFFPLFGAALGLLQARERVCVVLASSSRRNMDGGEEAIADRALDRSLRSASGRILILSIAAALVVAFLALFPG